MVQHTTVLLFLEAEPFAFQWEKNGFMEGPPGGPPSRGWLEELPTETAASENPGTPVAEMQTDAEISVACSPKTFSKTFKEEALHSTQIHEMLAPQREARALESAQAVIEEQKNRIEELTEALMHFQNDRGENHLRLQRELQEYVGENQRLRLQLDSLRAEIAALEKVKSRDEADVQAVVEQLAAAEKGIAERDQLIVKLQSHDKLAENEKLKAEQQRLLRQIDKMQKLLGSPVDGEAAVSFADNVAAPLAKVQRDIELHRGMTRQLGHTTEELRISKMCLVQAESNLLEGKKLIEEQRAEIQRLYKIVEALNREKALIPPVVVTVPEKAKGAGSEQFEALSKKLGYILEALDRQRKGGLGDDDRDERTSLAYLQQRMMEEQKGLLKRLLEGMDRMGERGQGRADSQKIDDTYFYAGNVLHACIEAEGEDPLYREKMLAVKEGTLLVFYDPKDEEPVAILRPHKVLKYNVDPTSLLVTIVYQPCPSRVDTHLFKLKTDDELNRWHHALAYAGFSCVAAPAIKTSPSTSPPSTQREEMLVNVFIPGGINFDGAATLVDRRRGRIIYLKARNELIITSPDDLSPLIIPCSEVILAVEKELCRVAFTSARNREMKAVVSTTQIFFEELLELVNQGTYWNPEAARKSPPPPPKPKPKTAKKEPEPPPKEEEDENELFVIRDGYLMLFDKLGDKDPILKLHNDDCVTVVNSKNREFVITHKPDTDDEETYVFSFPTDEVFKRWHKQLEENGFLKRKKNEKAGSKSNQVGVVSAGCLELYRDYGNAYAKPAMILMANRCTATASRERREIRIIHKKEEGKRERITLDCATLADFDRWNVALTFGKFLKSTDVPGATGNAYANLSKYVFPINLFEEASSRRYALQIKNRRLLLFAAPEATNPILSASADECEVQPVIAQRKLRVYINRNTPREQRIDFILALAKDFDRYQAACREEGFPEANVGKPGARLNIPFLLCRKGLIAVYKTKYHQQPDLLLEVAKFKFSEEGSAYVFDDGKHAQKAVVNSRSSRERWEFALKLAGFKEFSDTPPPRFFFPQIIYGFVTEEASDLQPEGFFKTALGLLQIPSAGRSPRNTSKSSSSQELQGSSSGSAGNSWETNKRT